MDNNWDFVEKVIYMNLAHRVDRRKEMETDFLKVFPKEKIVRLDAIQDPKYGFIGCTKSHVAILEMAIKNNWSTILVLEDDAMWNQYETGLQTLNSIVKENPRFDVIMLGATQANQDVQTKRLKRGLTSAGYIVQRHYYHVLLENIKEGLSYLEQLPYIGYQNEYTWRMHYCIDSFWSRLQAIDRWFIVTPALVIQRPSYSDIERVNVDYGVFFNKG